MPGVPLTNVFHLNVQTRLDDKVFTFGGYFRSISGYDANVSAVHCVTGFYAANIALIRGILSEQTTVEGIYCTHAQAESALPWTFPIGGLPGLRTGNGMPPASSLVLSLKADSVDAVRQGRAYIAGFSKDDIEDGRPNAALSAAGTALASSWIVPFTDSGETFEPVLVCRVRNGAPVTPFALTITIASMSPVLYSQRRRASRQRGYVS